MIAFESYVDWSSVLPIWGTQLVWSVTIITVTVTLVKRALKRESDRLKQALKPTLDQVKAMTYVAGEQAKLNADDIDRVKKKQDSQVAHVVHEVQAVPDKVVEKMATSEATTTG